MGKPEPLTRNTTIAEALRSVCSHHPRRVALVLNDERVSYQELHDRVRALAAGLQGLGLSKGDRIAMLLWSDLAFVYTFFAAAEIGAVVAPLPPRQHYQQLQTVLGKLQPSLVVASSDVEIPGGLEALRASCRQLAQCRGVLESGRTDLRAGSLESLLAARPAQLSARSTAGPDDLLAILFTSGTTGMAKGVMHSHRGLISPVVASIKLREMWTTFLPTPQRLGRWIKVLRRYGARLLRAAGRQQVFLSTMAMHTISGLEVLLQALLMGDRLILQPRFHPAQALEAIQKERATILIGVPFSFVTMLRMREFERYDLSSLLICATGAAPCPPEVAEEMRRRFGCAVHIGFGMTELGGGVAATMLEDSPERQTGTVGRAMPGMELKIVDEDGNPLPPGEPGELVCRSDSVMLGYFEEQGETDRLTDGEGFLHTGDIAVMDEQGYLRIVGRKKDVIIRAGVNIHPAKIENLLTRMEEVREAAVVGVPDRFGNEMLWAFIIPEENARAEPVNLISRCRAELELHEIPEVVHILKDFPRTSTGKAQKYKLRQMAMEEKVHGQ